ncbi:hypothetical protein FBU59_003538, partial [Linderina macrospora]
MAYNTQPAGVYMNHASSASMLDTNAENEHGGERQQDSRRRRRSSTYAMHVDSPYDYQQPRSAVQTSFTIPPPPQQQQQQHQHQQQQQQQFTPAYNDYYTYATTTAQMVDPWAFNHANLLANLSQLPPDLLPSLMPQLSNQNQQQQQPPRIASAQSMSALAAAAAAAVAAASGDPIQQQQQQTMHVDHTFAVPAVPAHRQFGSKNGILPSISSLQQSTARQCQGGAILHQDSQQQQHMPYRDPMSTAYQQQPNPNLSQFPQPQQPAPSYAPPPQDLNSNNYYGQQNLYYSAPMLQPLMLPPPSPTILSYYTADPTQWMSLLGQNAYQPQAYHYDYPLPAHQVPFNFPVPATPTYGVTPMQKNDPSMAAAVA